MTETVSDQQSLKYLLSGPQQKMFAKSSLVQFWSLCQVFEVGPWSSFLSGLGVARHLTVCLTVDKDQEPLELLTRGSDTLAIRHCRPACFALFFKPLCLLSCYCSLGRSCCFFQSSLCPSWREVSTFKASGILTSKPSPSERSFKWDFPYLFTKQTDFTSEKMMQGSRQTWGQCMITTSKMLTVLH